MILDLGPPPPGYKPGQTRGPLVRNIAVPLAVLAVTFACLRFYVRIFLVRVFGKDDWLLLAAVISLCCLVGSELWGISLGVGKHQYEVNREGDPHKSIPDAIMVMVFYYLCICCVQCSILCFYLRLGLAEIGGHAMRYIIYALMGFSIANNTILGCLQVVFATIMSFAIHPERYLVPAFFTYGSLNLLLDLTIWSTPLPSIFSIMHNLTTRKKVLLVLAFSVGMLSCFSSIMRIALRKYLFGREADPTYSSPIFYTLFVAEVSLAMTCVSLAALRPLVVEITKEFRRIRGKPPSTNKDIGSAIPEFGASPGPGHKGGIGVHTTITQKLEVWKDPASTPPAVPGTGHCSPSFPPQPSSDSTVNLTNTDTNKTLA